MFTYHINEKAKEKILSDISGIRSGGDAEQMMEMLRRFPETARGIDLRILEENADNDQHVDQDPHNLPSRYLAISVVPMKPSSAVTSAMSR